MAHTFTGQADGRCIMCQKHNSADHGLDLDLESYEEINQQAAEEEAYAYEDEIAVGYDGYGAPIFGWQICERPISQPEYGH